ncbi:MAG: hypothetical protein CMJ27_10850 [Phycisphaerae bacterium]|nr:hypothetical protein [Phycisphaerae bacterium]OUX00698.1 MAG: hypothetical protein CBD91_06145 [Phycisphaeraceae bacterium TMED231]
MEQVVPAAAAHGVTLDASVCVSEVERGRPAPDMLLECVSRLGLRPERWVVFDDTPVGIEAAVMPGRGVSLCGNTCVRDTAETAALSDAYRAGTHERAVEVFAKVGAGGTLTSVAALELEDPR